MNRIRWPLEIRNSKRTLCDPLPNLSRNTLKLSTDVAETKNKGLAPVLGSCCASYFFATMLFPAVQVSKHDRLIDSCIAIHRHRAEINVFARQFSRLSRTTDQAIVNRHGIPIVLL